MCGRYILPEIDLVGIASEAYKALANSDKLHNGYEARPGDNLPVIAPNKLKTISAFLMKWGYALDNKLVINAKSETVHDKKMFIDGITNRRCVIPIKKYIEWKRFDKTKEEIKPVNQEISYLAGIYRIVNGKPEFTILTRQASESVIDIHERMPIVFTEDLAMEYLKQDYDVDLILTSSLTNMSYEPQIKTFNQ